MKKINWDQYDNPTPKITLQEKTVKPESKPENQQQESHQSDEPAEKTPRASFKWHLSPYWRHEIKNNRYTIIAIVIAIMIAISIFTIGLSKTLLFVFLISIAYFVGAWRDGKTDVFIWLRKFL